MLFCRNCGQCIHISNDNFVEYSDTSGWESSSIDPVDGEYVEYIDGETTDSQHDTYECPCCDSNDIDFDSDVTREEALELRRTYNNAIENKYKKESEWDE